MKKQKEKSPLQKARIEWKKKIEGKSKQEIVETIKSHIDNVYQYQAGKTARTVEILKTYQTGYNCGFEVMNVITGKDFYIPPWHLLIAKKIPKRKMCPALSARIEAEGEAWANKVSEWLMKLRGKQAEAKAVDKIRVEFYQTIYKNWKAFLDAEISNYKKLGDAVQAARQKITSEFCCYYEGSITWSVWQEVLRDLPRKMHPTYIPLNSKGEECWDSEFIKTN